MGGVAAVSIPASAVTAAASVEAAAERPELINAHKRLLAAREELKEAKSALEWIADEWRHVWPLAPEEILGFWGADRGVGASHKPERDIIGNFLYRDARGRTRDCFSVDTPEDVQWWIDNFRKRKARGRTPETLRKSQEVIERNLCLHERNLELAIAYQKKTAELREKAGIPGAKSRINRADKVIEAICTEISLIPALGYAGLAIKADALKSSGIFDAAYRGPLKEMGLFIQAVLDMNARALS
ncbi:UNVERIFIED_ORG: hypothetical protein J2W66_003131 [Agrobacterium larrymoorei]|nr:hypothetical protein [Agrobacterium larrymoorei]